MRRRIDKFNRAAVNHALEPIGVTVPRNIKAGHALIRFADDRLEEAYDRALIDTSFAAATWALSEAKIQETSCIILSAEQQRRLGTIIEHYLRSRFETGPMDGQSFKTAEKDLSSRAWELRERFHESELGGAVAGVVSAMQASLCFENPAQAHALRRVFDARIRFDVIIGAGSGVGADGRFTPKDILCAALHQHPEGYLRGKAPMQRWVRSGNWGAAVMREGPYNEDARLDDLVKEITARLSAWDRWR